MDLIIGFFRDVLDGPLYIIIAVICGILICSCIGYLAEQSLNKKKKEQEYNETHTTVVATETPPEQVVNNTNYSNVAVPNTINQNSEIGVTQSVNNIPQQTVPTVNTQQQIEQTPNPIEQLNSTVASNTEQLAQQITDFTNQPIPNTIEMPEQPQPTIVTPPNNQV